MKRTWLKMSLAAIVIGMLPSVTMAAGRGGFGGGSSRGGWGRSSGGTRVGFSIGFGFGGFGGFGGYYSPFYSRYAYSPYTYSPYLYASPYVYSPYTYSPYVYSYNFAPQVRYYYPSFSYRPPLYLAPAPRYYYRDNSDYYYDGYRPSSYFDGGASYYRR